MPLEPGMHATVTLMVGGADTAEALGSGSLAVLGTPRAVALAEQATVRAVEAALESGATTVGTRVELDHLRASAVGDRVEAHAELVEVDGRRLAFRVELRDRQGVLASGTVVRVVVDAERFMARLAAR